MTDVLSREQRTLNMSRIKGKDTKPEMLLRRGLHALGFRYQLHRRELPGCPDLVFPRYRAAIFVHGCFWHRHECRLFKVPETRTEFWRKKIWQNYERDQEAVKALRHEGWRILIVWECALRGTGRLHFENVLLKTDKFLMGNRGMAEIKGT
jgi:DNA mismatch endonuclease (patch repair protein)